MQADTDFDRRSWATPSAQAMLRPATNVRAFLKFVDLEDTLPVPGDPATMPIVRVIWNRSTDPDAQGYRITISANGEILDEGKVPRNQQIWDSRPLTLSHPKTVATVYAVRDEQQSEAAQHDVPLTIGFAGLIQTGPRRDQHELPAATVKALAEDPTAEDILWVGTDGAGLARLDTSSNAVIHASWLTELDGLGGNHIFALQFSRIPPPNAAPGTPSGILWIATDGGLTRLSSADPNPSLETFDYRQDMVNDLQTSTCEITAMYEDSDGVVWLGTTGEGLIRFDPQSRKGKHITTADGLPNDTVWYITEDESTGMLLVGTNLGLGRLSRSGNGIPETLLHDQTIRSLVPIRDGHILAVTPEKIFEISEHQVVSRHTFSPTEEPLSGVLLAPKGRDFWVGTQRGLDRFRPGERPQDFRAIVRDRDTSLENSGEEPDLSLTEVSALATGHDGFIWAGLPYSGDVVRLDPRTWATTLFRSGRLSVHQPVNALEMDSAGNLWMGTQRGLMEMSTNREFKAFTNARASFSGGDAMPMIPILSMKLTEPNTLWLGLKHEGLMRFDTRNSQFRTIIHSDHKVDNSLTINGIEVAQSGLYAATESAGVRVFAPNSGDEYTSIQLTRENDRLPHDRVLSLFWDQQWLWIGTAQGLRRGRISDGTQGPPRVAIDDRWPPVDVPDALRANTIYAIEPGPQDSLWAATGVGLWRRRWAPPNNRAPWEQMLSVSIEGDALSLAFDADSRLWVGNSRGLYRSAPLADRPDAYAEEPIRILTDVGKVLAVVIDAKGTAWVGTDNGLMAVPPFKVSRPTVAPTHGWSLVILVLSLGGLACARWYWTFRHPFVVAVRNSAEALAMVRLPELPMAVSALRRAHRLQAALLLLGLDAQRWRRILASAEAWPTSTVPTDADHCERVVRAVMDVLGAEIIPAQLVLRPAYHRPDRTIQRHTPAGDPSALEILGELPFVYKPQKVDEHDAGFDAGAPGAGRERLEPTPEAVALRQESDNEDESTWEIDEEPGEIVWVSDELPHTFTDPRHPVPTPRDEHLRTLRPDVTPQELGGPLVYGIRLPELPIRLTHREVPLLVVRSPLPEEDPAAPLLRCVRELSLSPRYVLVLNLSREPQLPVLSGTDSRFVPFNEPEVRSLLFSPSPRTSFVRHFIRQVKVTEVSPYSSKGEVANPLMFVGRRLELDRITGNDRVNYSIVGARQIGKSSLIGALKRHYRDRARREVHSFTLTPQEDARGLYKRFALLLKRDRIPRDSTEFAEMMEAHYRGSRPPALFLIDEVDGLLARERVLGYPVLTALRRLQQQEICSFVIAGYWELYRLGNDYHSPLYNMAEVLELGPLKPDEARDLIVSPMERMGLTFKRRAIVEEIVDATAGHPHLIQFICNQLLERMTASHAPVFTAEDWHAVQDSDELKRYVTRNFKSNAGPLDELIVYITLVAMRFGHRQVELGLKERGLNIPLKAREESLRKLKLVGILRELEGRFEYSLPLFRRMLLKEDVSYLADARARELREGMSA